MTEREKLMRKLSAVDFAAHELQIYLDTHPDDSSAAQALSQYDSQALLFRQDYENRFGPLTPGSNGSRWAWIADPWPWNNEEA